MAAAAARKPPIVTGSATGGYTGSRSGTAYKLGHEIGAGGNGVVYTVARRPELVAKIQKHAMSAHDVAKIEMMAQGATPELLSVAAWPMDALKSGTGQVVGFVMPRIPDARPLFELYSPRSRIQHFPSADFRFLVHAAANVARLFAAVHKAGFICGDVNHSNILVRQTGTVAAVDCDSFQVGDGSRFPCLVGTELFVPPELMGAALGATRRTPNHDNFGLAVLIFHLLFMGRHPFAGRYLGRGDMPIEQALAECRYAYSRDQRRTQLVPPPLTPPTAAMGSAVADLFERAFAPEARNGGRPSPEAWIDALDALKAALVPCAAVPWHHHLTTSACPWCAIEGPARIKLFGGIIKVATAAIADLETLWARYLALTEPGPPRPLPQLQHTRPPIALKLPRPRLPSLPTLSGSARRWAGDFVGRVHCNRLLVLAAGLYFAVKFFTDELLGLSRTLPAHLQAAQEIVAELAALPAAAIYLAVLTVVAGPLVVLLLKFVLLRVWRIFVDAPTRSRPTPGAAAPASPGKTNRWAARRAWRAAAAAWQAQAPPPDVTDLKAPIDALKQQLDALALDRETRIKVCAAPEPEDAQRARFLGAFRIEDAKLAGIGPARCAVLRSWGIDTAADIDEAKIAEIPGFGRGLTDKLVIWREAKEKSFILNTGSVVDPLDVQRIHRQLATRRTKLMKELREKIAEVECRMKPFHDNRARLWADVEAARAVMRP